VEVAGFGGRGELATGKELSSELKNHKKADFGRR
jgi:hypothetical protein